MSKFGADHSVKHGYVGTRTYRAWKAAKSRCNDPKNDVYCRYGAVGVRFYEGWGRFSAFLADVGPAPSDEHQIDRIESSKGYEPGNVRWATRSQNAANVRHKNSTGFRGVGMLPSGRYRAVAHKEGVRFHIGVFPTAQEAADAYDRKAIELFGEYALTNKMDCVLRAEGDQ